MTHRIAFHKTYLEQNAEGPEVAQSWLRLELSAQHVLNKYHPKRGWEKRRGRRRQKKWREKEEEGTCAATLRWGPRHLGLMSLTPPPTTQPATSPPTNTVRHRGARQELQPGGYGWTLRYMTKMICYRRGRVRKYIPYYSNRWPPSPTRCE